MARIQARRMEVMSRFIAPLDLPSHWVRYGYPAHNTKNSASAAPSVQSARVAATSVSAAWERAEGETGVM